MNNKLHISLSFDDGRIDNYTNVLPIIKKYGLKATVHVITGYVDGTYCDKLASSSGACNITQLQEMKKNGFEISIHGDKHITEIDDYNTCIKKLKKWKLLENEYGFSIPHSDEKKITNEFKNNLNLTQTKYIRTGKNLNLLGYKYKILYLLSIIFSSGCLFNLYNEINVNKFRNMDVMLLHSVVIKKNIKWKMIKKMIKKRLSNDEWIILMFHSVLDKNNPLYHDSNWVWSTENFEKLCSFLSILQKNNIIVVDTMINIVRRCQQ